MPVFNAERYLDEAITSVLCQHFKDFEFIIINDGSTDGTAARLASWAKQDDRIRIIEQTNKGVTRSLNVALAEARGRFIARMDSDDVALPARFERQLATINTDPQLLVVGGWVTVIDEMGRSLYPMRFPVGSAVIEQCLLAQKNPLCHPCTMIRAEAMRHVGGYCDEMRTAQDYDLWLRLSEIGKLDNVPETLLRYRRHAGAISWRRADEQSRAAWRACANARARRGYPPPVEPKPARRRNQTQAARHAVMAKKAFRAGYIGAAKAHARDAIQRQVRIVWRPLMWTILLWPMSGRANGVNTRVPSAEHRTT
jgi:glycosyltransferase involved in cell wall biosynthesis